MAKVIEASKQFVEANGTTLYCEVRGAGPAVLFIAGATGDAGHFEKVAEQLAGEFTVITYDRRGNSRSPKPAGWSRTSVEEQAEDAAGLIRTLGATPATIFATSGGGAIGLELVLRHPELIRGVLIHEPVILNVLGDQVSAMMAGLKSDLEAVMAQGGPRAATEQFVRMAAGDAAYEAIDPEPRGRMLGNGETLFGIELEGFVTYHPEEAAIAAIERPIRVFISTDTATADPSQLSPAMAFVPAVCDWLSRLVHSPLGRLSGKHAPYFDRPAQMAAELRPYLRELTAR